MSIAGQEFRSVIYNAARDQNLKRIETFLSAYRSPEWIESCLNSSEVSDKIPLVVACRVGGLEIIKYLINKGANPNARGTVSFDGETILSAPPLWAASAAGHLEVVKYLVEEAGSEINLATCTNSTPLRGACYDGHIEIVKYLVERGADIEKANRHGHTPLMIACFRGKIEVAEYLIWKGASVTRKSSKGNTALHDAAEGNQAAICRLLIGAGAKLEKDDLGLTPLMSSALLGNEETVAALMMLCESNVEKRDVYKILGCTRCDKKMDMHGAIDAWESAMRVRLSEEEQKNLDDELNSQQVLQVYNGYKEIRTLEDVQGLSGQPDAIYMQSLIMRERVLGGANVDVHYYLRFRGAVYCDIGNVQRCFDLWFHALELQQDHLSPLNMSTVATFQAFQETFGMAANEHVIHFDGGRMEWTLRSEQVAALFDRLCLELDRLVEWGDKPLYPECCGEDHDHHPEQEKDKLVLIGLQLLLLLHRLSLPLHAFHEHGDNDAFFDQLQAAEAYPVDVKRLVKACRKLDLRPLHLALQESDRVESAQLPANYVTEQLLKAGASVFETDEDGCTPLHILLLNERPRESIVIMLLDQGAPILARNFEDNTCLDLIELSRLERVQSGKYITLRGLASNAVRRQFGGWMEADIIPADITSFLFLH